MFNNARIINSLTRKMSTSAKPVDHWSFLSSLAKSRQQSPTRALMPFMKIPGMINLGTGLPNSNYFPFTSLSFTLDDGTKLDLTPAELQESLQYSATPGMPSLLTQLKDITKSEQNPKYKDWDLCVTTGSQDALTKAFEMLLSPGDILVVEAPTYPGALAYLKPMGARFLPIPTDADGIRADLLREQVLALSPEDRARCRVLYTIPTGQNPAGVTATPERKKKVYDVCRELDMLILEDDPYWQLDFTAIDSAQPRQSYMSLDTDQRVLRFESMSKILSSGLRLGWAAGPKLLIERLCLATQATTLHASGVPQAMVTALLRAWGPEGWARHIDKARRGYRDRRDWMLEAIEEELGGLVEYSVPQAGMFVWLKIKNSPMPAQALIEAKAVDNKVLMLPGEAFLPPTEMCVGSEAVQGDYVRVAYSVASKEQMREGMKRFKIMLTE